MPKKSTSLQSIKLPAMLKERYETALHKSGTIFYDWDPTSDKATFIGDTNRMLGFTQEASSGNWFNIIHPIDYEPFQELLTKTLTDKSPFSMQYRVQKKDGEYIIVKDDGYIITVGENKEERMVGFVVDVTNHVKELATLREREKRYRELVESQHELIVRLDRQGRFTFVNDYYCKLFGQTKRQLIGTAFTPMVHEDDLADTLEAMKHLEQPPYRVYVEQRAKTAQGQRWIAWEYYAIKNIHGETVEIQAIGRDVTARKLAQQRLKNRTEDLEIAKAQLEQDRAKDRALLESIGDGMIATDHEGNVTIMNQAAEKMLGWTLKEIGGNHVDKLIAMENEYGEIIPREERPNTLALTTGEKTIAKRYYYVRKDGSTFPAEITVTPVIGNKKIIGTIKVFRDITREIQIDQAKNELISLASHQLRTPLSTITWLVEALLRKYTGPVTDDQKTYLDEIDRATQRMIGLVNDFLSVSQIEMGTLAIEPEHTHIPDIAKSVLQELSKHTQEKKLTISEHYDVAVPRIYADPSHIRMVLQNLLMNAIKYTPENGRVSISITYENHQLLIQIADTGYGIPERQHSEIFTKLFRADNVKERDTNGTGLGLYIVKSLLNQSGGNIWFDSTENKGTTFYISLPTTIHLSEPAARQGAV